MGEIERTTRTSHFVLGTAPIPPSHLGYRGDRFWTTGHNLAAAPKRPLPEDQKAKLDGIRC
jgi:hypothetical protein